MDSNAVTRALDSLQTLWDDYRYQSEAPICRWLVQQNAHSMIDAFYQVNAEESDHNDDIFLRFEAPFNNALVYGAELTEELTSFVQSDQEALSKDGIEIKWKSNYTIDDKNLAVGFIRELFHFTLSLELDDEDKLVAYLSPVTIEDGKAWKQWWTDASNLYIPPQLRLMVSEPLESSRLTKISEEHPDKINTLKPDLDGAAIMRQLMNEYGDQEDDCTHFRKAYFELTQAVGKGNISDIDKLTQRSMMLARKIGFPHLEITVLCTAGNGYAMGGNLDKGLLALDNARELSKKSAPLPLLPDMPDLKVDLPGGNIFDQLALQAAFYKGAALLGVKDYNRAFASYRDVVIDLRETVKSKSVDPKGFDWTNGGIISFHLIEALRMAGYCLERQGLADDAILYYGETITIAEKMEPVSRKSTSMNYAAKSLINIYKDKNKKQEYLSIKEKINHLLGMGWEDNITKRSS